jgi:predicted Zn-dependent protease
MHSTDYQNQLKLIEENVNISKGSLLIKCIQLLLGISIFCTIMASMLYFFSDFCVTLVPDSTVFEIQNLLQGEPALVADMPKREQYLQGVLDRLKKHTILKEQPLRIKIEDSIQSNAFAKPGNIIILTQPFLEELESENELAMVLSHELGHFVQRDHLKSWSKLVISILFSVFLLNATESASVLMDQMDFSVKAFSREAELSADRFALELMNTCYEGNSSGVKDFFVKAGVSDNYITTAMSYASTHPTSKKRIKQLKLYAKELGMKEKGLTPIPDFIHSKSSEN